MRHALIPVAVALLAGCAESNPLPAPIARTEPSGNPLIQDSHLASATYAGPARVLPWVPLEPTPGFGNPAPEPFPGYNGRGY